MNMSIFFENESGLWVTIIGSTYQGMIIQILVSKLQDMAVESWLEKYARL